MLHCPANSWQEKQTGLVRKEIESLLATLSGEAGLYNIIRESLGATSPVEASCRRPWSLLPVLVCDAVSGSCEHALPASAALQLFMAALEVFDDVEDADSSASLAAKYGDAVATNVATTLLILAEREIAMLQRRDVADRTTVRIMDAMNSFLMTACAGQHLDLSLTPGTPLSEDSYLRIAAMKSASTMECACHIGALLATASESMVDIFTEFGHNLGMASQIANDIEGVTRGTDIVRRKVTLPVVYALAQADGESRRQLETAFGKPCESVPAPGQIKNLLFQSGAVHYATIKMELYRQRALDNLSQVEKAGASVERLKPFLE